MPRDINDLGPDDLDPDEDDAPFEAFGQYGVGRMDLRVFDQDRYWVDVVGRPFRLEMMSEEYRKNVIDFLLRHQRGFHLKYAMGEIFDSVVNLARGEPDWSQVAYEFGLPFAGDHESRWWLESTPLMRRLRVLTPGYAAD